MTTHSILSPSGADRWSACPGSLAACKDVPEEVRGSNTAASLGTAKHVLTERCATHRKTAQEGALAAKFSIHADGTDFKVDDSFVEHVQFALDATFALPGQHLYEVRLDTSEVLGVEGQGGTSDVVVLDHESRTLTVLDYKFGWGRVSAFKNKQLMIYLCAARKRFGDLFDFDKFRLIIVQPPLNVIDGADHYYMAEDLDQFEREVRQKAVLAYELYVLNDAGMTAANLSPSDKGCQWCPIAGQCVARNKSITDQFKVVSVADPATIDDAKLGALMIFLEDTVKPFMAAAMSEGYKRALNGKAPDGWGMYEGRPGNRVFMDNFAAEIATTLEMTLGDDMYEPRKLKSPTQVEAALKAANAKNLYVMVEQYVHRPEGKPSLQRARTDKPPARLAAMPEFQDVTAAATS